MAVVTIDGIVKRTATAIRKPGEDDQKVVGQVVVEFELDSGGIEALQKLLKMLDNTIRCQLTDGQLELPSVGTGAK